jgi:hypothetical protein
MMLTRVAAADSSAPSEALAPQQSRGPFASEAAARASLSCLVEPSAVTITNYVPDQPFMKVSAITCRVDGGLSYYALLRTRRGVYLSAELRRAVDDGHGAVDGMMRAARLEPLKRAGAPPALRLFIYEYRAVGGVAHAEHLAICGVGRSGAPSCTSAFALTETARNYFASQHPSRDTQPLFRVTVEYDGAGYTLRAPLADQRNMTDAERRSLGHHRLEFP